MISSGLLARFLMSAVVGGVVAVGTAVLAGPAPIISTARAGAPVALTGVDGAPLTFGLQSGNPVPLEPLPPTATIQLTSFHAPTASAPPTGNEAPAWLKSSTPRIPTVTQFDGGPLEGVNCVMAAGAMLARLGFGIVTTGSQMRALQDDQDGATNLANLADAVRRGWGVRFFNGALSPLQLRALLYAGAGAVVIGNYGELPVGIRLQRGFTGSHAVYIDAFRPPGPEGPAAYWVMDPIGYSWPGYKGHWWPAEDVERFATSFGGGTIHSAWAFPGGVVPADHKVLPRDAYPGATPDPRATPDVGPSASPVTAEDPMPVDSTPLDEDSGAGEDPPPGPRFPRVDVLGGKYEMEPGFQGCLALPAPLGCPRGIVGIIDLLGGTLTTASPPPLDRIDLLYANPIAPDTYQIIFEPPPDSDPDLWAWDSRGDGTLQQAAIETGLLDGKFVAIATITLAPDADYSFVATASGDGVRALSSVGSLEVTR
jgi:hypothetical protein